MNHQRQPLIFQNEKEFTILQLTDLHFMDLPLDDVTSSLISRLARDCHPDLICITGDLTMDPKCLELHKRLDSLMESFSIPWTYVFGNHDTEGGISKTDIIAIHENSQFCYFESGELTIHGQGNYHHIVYNQSGQPVINLIFMDSNETRIDLIEGSSVWSYDYIYPDQMDWYQKVVKASVDSSLLPLPSLVFFHIPLPEFNAVSSEKMIGERHENVSCSNYNLGFFDVMKSLGSTKGVFVGHDHYNDYAFSKDGILLAFGRVTGHYEYAQIPFTKGGRIISVKPDGTFVTSIRLETEV